MGTTFNFIDDIVPGIVDWNLKVRVIRLWKVANKMNPNDVNSVEMLLLDEKSGKIQATIKKHIISKFEGFIEEGSTYLIDKLSVGQNDVKYRKTAHKFKLAFITTTTVTPINVEGIAKNHFDFMPFSTILQQPSHEIICDIIGQVVEKDNVKEMHKDGRLMKLIDIVLEDLEQTRINCTLWGEYADNIESYIESLGQAGPIIIVLQLCRLNKFQSIMGIASSFYGTKMFLDDDTLPEVVEYKSKMEGQLVTVSQSVTQRTAPKPLSLAEDLIQTPKMTISDLVESSEKCFGSVYATVIDLDLAEGWVYDSCNTCMKRVTKVGCRYECGFCRVQVPATPRFKVQLQVIDHTGSTTLTLFNSVVEKFLGKSAVELLRFGHQSKEFDTPAELLELVGNKYLFKVEVSEGNIINGWQTFTAKKITCDLSIVQQYFRHHDLLITNAEEEADFEEHMEKLADENPITSLDDLQETPTTNVTLQSHEESSAATSGEKRSLSDISPITFPDLDLISPSTSKVPRTTPEVDVVNFSNINFSTPPANKKPMAVVKKEHKD